MKIERYKTIGVQMEIPSELQVLLWKLQEEIRCKQTRIDYLQVYELKIIERKDGREQVFYIGQNILNMKSYIIFK